MVACLLALATARSSALAQFVVPGTWTPNGPVLASARAGKVVYLAGGFGYIGPATGSGVTLRAADGGVRAPWPAVTGGAVEAVLSVGAGGWYLGGGFTRVDGQPRARLAHVLADGTVSAWDPGADSTVHALARLGANVLAGGAFFHVGGVLRSRLAAVDAATGAVAAWHAGAGGGSVLTLAVAGPTVYAGGTFTSMVGQPRDGIAALEATDGSLKPWNPKLTTAAGGIASIYALVPAGTLLLVTGDFLRVGYYYHPLLAALDTTTGEATSWDPKADGPVRSLACDGSTVYLGGLFSHVGVTHRRGLAAVSLATGLATGWAPAFELPGGDAIVVGAIALAGGALVACTNEYGHTVGAFDLVSGFHTWLQTASDDVHAVACLDSVVCAGGAFASLGGSPRVGLAAFDADAGTLLDWNPGIVLGLHAEQAALRAIVAGGSTVYVGGEFAADLAPRMDNLAAVDARSGYPRAGWSPGCDGGVSALALAGATLLAGGSFTTVGGRSRAGLAALDTLTGGATEWDPSPAGGGVRAIVSDGSTVSVGGDFTAIGGLPRAHLAAVDAVTAAPAAWDPGADGPVYALAREGDIVYAGGAFTHMGAQARSAFAALDAVTGAPTAQDLHANGVVRVVVPDGNVVWIGGGFDALAGETRRHVAALGSGGATLDTWDAGANADVYALAVHGQKLFIGGDFDSLAGVLTPNLGMVVPPATVQAGGPSLERGGGLWLSPNPSATSVTIGFTLAAPASVSVTLFDVAGRRVRSLLDHEARAAGPVRADLRTAGLAPGLYLVRLSAGSWCASRRLVVLR